MGSIDPQDPSQNKLKPSEFKNLLFFPYGILSFTEKNGEILLGFFASINSTPTSSIMFALFLDWANSKIQYYVM